MLGRPGNDPEMLEEDLEELLGLAEAAKRLNFHHWFIHLPGNLLGTKPRLEEGEDGLEDFEDDGQDDEPRDLQTNAKLLAIPRER